MKSLNTLKYSALALLLLFSSCSNGSNFKNVKESIGKLSDAVENTETRTESNASSDDDYDKVMIPAALNDRPEQILKRKGYVTSYNKDTKLPNWVAWHLTAAHVNGTSSRKGIKFQEDEDVPSPRATHYDYVRSGYDRGHMCPAGDNKWSDTAMEQSFLLTNICPQNPNLNRGDWNEMENACRDWAAEYGDVVVVAGPIFYKGNHKKIGKNKVLVPEAFFKVVLTLGDNPKAVGFIYKNNSGNRPKDAYINSVDDVERITGMDFFPALPDSIEDKIEKYTKLL